MAKVWKEMKASFPFFFPEET